MLSLLTVFGILLWPTGVQAAALSAIGASNVYLDVVEITLDEYSVDQVELEVQEYVEKVIGKDDDDTPHVKAEDVDAFITEEYFNVCREKDKPITFLECEELANLAVPGVVLPADKYRTLGRDLQMIATTFEHAGTGLSSSLIEIPLKLRSISNIWQSGSDLFFTRSGTSHIRYVAFEDEDTQEELQKKIGDVAGKLPPPEVGEGKNGSKVGLEKRLAAVWRYRHGLSTAPDECDEENENGDGTELQYTKPEWCVKELEEELQKLQDFINEELDKLERPPKDDEIVIVKPQPLGTEGGGVVWMRSDDVGLDFNFPLQPVLPSLNCEDTEDPDEVEECEDDAILGGLYPDPPEEPEEGEGLCSHPFAKFGYLCRPIDTTSECDDIIDSDGVESIKLTTCRVPPLEKNTPERQTESGPDICRIGGWQEEVGQSESRTAPSCSNCSVSFRCGNCAQDRTFTPSVTEKNEDGIIEICLPSSGLDVESSAVHALILAQQQCGQPSSFFDERLNDASLCCSSNYQAYLAQCNALIQDGIINPDQISAELCASASVEGSCQSSCTDLDRSIIDKTKSNIEAMLSSASGGASCSDVSQQLNQFVQTGQSGNLHPRLRQMVSSLTNVCTPECRSSYRNTIGNNLCFIGQCIEEGIEEHRLTAGRMPLTAGDEAYPFDACMLPEPKPDTAYTVPTLPYAEFPPYNPELVVRLLDQALCQTNGLPAMTPPVLCSTDTNRRFALLLPDYYSMTESLADQHDEHDVPTDALEGDALLVGHRMGSQLYAEQLARPWKYFGEMIDAINDQLDEILATTFPTAMCPQSFTEDVCEQLRSNRT